MIEKRTFLAALVFCILIAGCGGGGPGDDVETELTVGNISGPLALIEKETGQYSVTASGDKGIGYQWAVDPPTAGTFSNQTSATVNFTAGALGADVQITLRVTVGSDHHSSVVKSVTVTIRDDNPLGWTRTVGGSGWETGYGIAVDKFGNVYITGVFMGDVDFDPAKGTIRSSNGGYDAYLCKYNPDGLLQWVRTWGGPVWDQGFGIAIDNFGGISVTGWFQGNVDFDPGDDVDWHSANGDLDAFISKFDSAGAHQWTHTWGGSGWDNGRGVDVDSGGNIYVVGYFESTVDFDPGGGVIMETADYARDVFLSKFDASGGYIWTQTWDGEEGHSVVCDTNDNVYVSGMFNRSPDFDPGTGTDIHYAHGNYNDSFLSKFDAAGTFEWARTWGGDFAGDEATYVITDNSGSVYVTGYYQAWVDFDPGPGSDWQGSYVWQEEPTIDVFLSKFDASGTFIWARTWGGQDEDAAERLGIDKSGNVYVAGRFFETVDFNPGSGSVEVTSNGGRDIFMSKFDPSGAFKWTFTVGGPEDEAGWGVAIDDIGYVYITGLFHQTVDFDPGPDVDMHSSNGEADIFLSKIIPQDIY